MEEVKDAELKDAELPGGNRRMHRKCRILARGLMYGSYRTLPSEHGVLHRMYIVFCIRNPPNERFKRKI